MLNKTTRMLTGLAAGLLTVTALSGAAFAQSVNLTYLIPSGPENQVIADEVVKAFDALAGR